MGDIYDVNKYTENELFEILDLNNPTDRELEGKLHVLINKYEIMQTKEAKKLWKFFNDIYARLFELEEDDNDVVEGFDTQNDVNPLQEISGDSTNFISGEQNIPVSNSLISKENTPYVTDLQQRYIPVSSGLSNVKNNIPTTIDYTKQFNYTKGQLNPILKETITRIINIDSKYRDKSIYSSTNFTFNLNEILKDVVSLKLYSITIPCTWNTVSNDFGVNFMYIKGKTNGINDGNSDYKVTITGGFNYTPSSLIDAVNKSIIGLPNLYTDVSFANTNISIDPNTLRTSITLNIQKIYNDMYYNIYFPTWSDPTLNTGVITTIPALLGFNVQTYSSYNVYSTMSTTNNPVNYNPSALLTTNNNNFTIKLYYGTVEYESTSFEDITVYLGNTGNFNLNEIVSFVNSGFKQTICLQNSSMSSDIIYIGGVANYRYKINVVVDRKLIPSFNLNMKAVLIFPLIDNIWNGPSTIFNFMNSHNELNNIYGETTITSAYYPITNGPYMYIKCNKQYYGNDGINTYTTSNGFSVNTSNSVTYNVIGNNNENYEIGVGNYIVSGEEYTLINKKTDMSYGSMNVYGNKFSITGSNYTITDKSDNSHLTHINNNFYMTGQANIGGTNYNINSNYPYTLNAPIIYITGKIYIYGNQTVNYTVPNNNKITINSSDPNGYYLLNTNITDSINITGTTTIYSTDNTLYTVSGDTFTIIGNAKIWNNIEITSGTVTVGWVASQIKFSLQINNQSYSQTDTATISFNGDGTITISQDTNPINATSVIISSPDAFYITCLDRFDVSGITTIYNGESTMFHSNNILTIIGNKYTFSTETNVVGAANILNGTGNIRTVNSQLTVIGTNYQINGTIKLTDTTNINYGNVAITTLTNCNILPTTDIYLVRGSVANIISNINILSGNLNIMSRSNNFIINGNSYISSFNTGKLNGNTYTINGHSIITGTKINITGNVNAYINKTLNDFKISVLNTGENTTKNILSDYLVNLNTSCSTLISNTPDLIGSNITFYIDQITHYIDIDFSIKKMVTGKNYCIDTTDSFFNTLLEGSTIFQGLDESYDIYGTIAYGANGYPINDNNNTFYVRGVASSAVSPNFSIKLSIPNGTYASLSDLALVINQTFNPNYPYQNNNTIDGVNISNCRIIFTPLVSNTNIYQWTFTMYIYAMLTSSDYSVYFYDNDLISGQIYDGSSNFYNNLINEWTNSPNNTWYNYLHLSNETYNLSQQTIVLGTIQLSAHLITINSESNYFVLQPTNTLYGIPGTGNQNIIIVDYNNKPLDGVYPFDLFIEYFNYTMSKNTLLSGTQLVLVPSNQLNNGFYVKLRLNINKIYNTSDFNIVFFDYSSFSYCNTGFTGTKSIKAVEWDSTLGWLLGYHNSPSYNMNPESVATSPIDGHTYYIGYPDNRYTYDTNGNSATLYADTVLNVNIYNNFMIILEDYAQNHLNDGLLTLAATDYNIPMPSYANAAAITCDLTNNKPVLSQSTSEYNSLTANQIYAANQILNIPKSVFSSRGYLEDVFAVIPINPVANGGSIVVLGSTLMIQERSYFGPVNIHRMSIKLVTDKGNIANINNADWSFSLACEKLYSQNT